LEQKEEDDDDDNNNNNKMIFHCKHSHDFLFTRSGHHQKATWQKWDECQI